MVDQHAEGTVQTQQQIWRRNVVLTESKSLMSQHLKLNLKMVYIDELQKRNGFRLPT